LQQAFEVNPDPENEGENTERLPEGLYKTIIDLYKKDLRFSLIPFVEIR
jgi:hypothetical protein